MAILVTGGARSGKSAFAERCAARLGGSGIYVATCRPYDEEMKERIGKHRSDRDAADFAWETVEEPFETAALLDAWAERFRKPTGEAALAARPGEAGIGQADGCGSGERVDGKPPVVLLDCLTLWLTNWLLRLEEPDGGSGLHETPDEQAERRATGGPDRLQTEIDRLTDAIARYPHPLIVVTNEVGDGIVPSYPLGRRFRDEAGRLNQRIAAVCERVFLVTAGIAVDLKAMAFRPEEL